MCWPVVDFNTHSGVNNYYDKMSDTHRQAYYILELFIDIVNLLSVSITIKLLKKWLFVGGFPLNSLICSMDTK